MLHLSPPDSEQARRGSREPLRKGDWEPRWDREGVSLHHRLGAASCPSRFPALRQTGTASGGSPVPAERIWLLPPPAPHHVLNHTAGVCCWGSLHLDAPQTVQHHMVTLNRSPAALAWALHSPR